MTFVPTPVFVLFIGGTRVGDVGEGLSSGSSKRGSRSRGSKNEGDEMQVWEASARFEAENSEEEDDIRVRNRSTHATHRKRGEQGRCK